MNFKYKNSKQKIRLKKFKKHRTSDFCFAEKTTLIQSYKVWNNYNAGLIPGFLINDLNKTFLMIVLEMKLNENLIDFFFTF
ncbi:hypothetical protein BpHYR1_039475 [Brachionus plicatilis]|uniref:Uncharacterized protein n=1 Tax=Brachionus plicatilis TaxID=10195 RepID=A0A3M7QSM6_BRAPC|nr:hypothetical protein BpHYR1_039475 [Brachionus plicatilis]